jgi:hypothetical protein
MAQAADPIIVSKRDQELMNEFLRGGNTPQKVVFRITIILGAAEGIANAKLARDLGTTRSSVLKWRARYLSLGLEGLRSAKRKKEGNHSREGSGDCAGYAEDETAAGTHWSTRTMAEAQGVSDTTVHRIWKTHRLQPHRVTTFKFSRDPQFVEKVRYVGGL